MKIRIEPGFAVFTLLVYALVGELVWPFFWAAGVHELSHLAAVWLLGRKVKIVTLRFADGQIMTAPMGYVEEAACALAGPAANLLCCWLFRFWAPAFAALSLLLGCYNLLPVEPLDGGRALRAAIAPVFGHDAAQRASLAVSVCVCTALLLAAGYAAAFCGAGVWPLLAAGRLSLRLALLEGRREKQVAFPAAGG